MSLFGANPFCRCSCLRHQICAWYDFQSYGMTSGTRLKLSIPADKCAQWPWRKVRPTRTCSASDFFLLLQHQWSQYCTFDSIKYNEKNVSSYVHAVAHSGMGKNSITKHWPPAQPLSTQELPNATLPFCCAEGCYNHFLKWRCFIPVITWLNGCSGYRRTS